MSRAKFTPGPWTAEDESVNSITIRATSKSAHKLGREITAIINEEGVDVTPRMRADARLIVAAPALYDALKAVLVMAGKGAQPRKLDESLTWRECDEKARAMADAAIALVEGQA